MWAALPSAVLSASPYHIHSLPPATAAFENFFQLQSCLAVLQVLVGVGSHWLRLHQPIIMVVVDFRSVQRHQSRQQTRTQLVVGGDSHSAPHLHRVAALLPPSLLMAVGALHSVRRRQNQQRQEHKTRHRWWWTLVWCDSGEAIGSGEHSKLKACG